MDLHKHVAAHCIDIIIIIDIILIIIVIIVIIITMTIITIIIPIIIIKETILRQIEIALLHQAMGVATIVFGPLRFTQKMNTEQSIPWTKDDDRNDVLRAARG